MLKSVILSGYNVDVLTILLVRFTISCDRSVCFVVALAETFLLKCWAYIRSPHNKNYQTKWIWILENKDE